MASQGDESLLIRPGPREWAKPLTEAARHTRADAGLFRRELGLPTDRALVLTGHQPEFWHPGILAKYLAADAAARRWGAASAWLVVDQARPVAVPVRYPARVDGGVRARELVFGSGGEPPTPDDAAAPCVREGLARIVAAMAGARDEPVLARRVGRALAELMGTVIETPAPTFYATDLSRTSLFRDLVARMQREPERCIRAYNAAAERHRTTGVRPLLADEVQDRWELPLWHLGGGAGGVRRRVFAEMLGQVPTQELAPRALMMTGLLRLAGCDLFIHGTGGGGQGEEHEGYDAVTEEWLIAWLGPRPLAPIAVVTSTLLLPLAAEPPPSPGEVRRAVWAAHRARHDPAMVGDAPAAAQKRALVEAIAGRRDRPAREGLFRTMHAALDDYRARHGPELRTLDRRAQELASRLADAAVLADRTWPFPIYPDEQLRPLKDRIDRAFGLERLKGSPG